MRARWFVLALPVVMCGCRCRGSGGAEPQMAQGRPHEAPALRVNLAPVTAGTRWQIAHRGTVAFAAQVETADASRLGEAATTEQLDYQVEVVVAEGAELTAAKVTFQRAERQGEAEQDTRLAVAGRSYFIRWGPSSAEVAQVDGGLVSQAEVGMVRSAADVVRPSELQLELARQPYEPGRHHSALAEAFALTYARREDTKGGPPTFVEDPRAVVEDSGDAVSVRVVLNATTKDEEMTMFTRLNGVVEIEKATGLVRAIRLDGTMDLAHKRGRSSGRISEVTTVTRPNP